MQPSQPKISLRISFARARGKSVYLNCLAVILLCLPANSSGLQPNNNDWEQTRPLSLAVLDFGESTFAHLAADKLAANFKREAGVMVLDRDQVRAAARGVGYAGSISLSLTDARDLGAALGCDFFILGDAQTLRRSPSNDPVYFDSYASIFVVSSRTGRLIRWDRPNYRAPSAAAAEQSLLAQLAGGNADPPYIISIRRAQEAERGERELTTAEQIPIIEAAPDDEKSAASEGLRLPRPYRRLVPAYPETAARAEAEATVDVLVDLDSGGEVTRVEVSRWAGFGLDEATVETVRRLHFFPAMRDGVPISIRVLLRYNFRKPPKP
ncbi:MAG TPA: energy transducer TonB [Pyrinomonadaceae bacterium]|jgi:TonB family protein|nr:energy transducer TonB [Pyrinomonadaceae bacterium]